MIRVSILGASGYVGGELMRLIAAHPDMEVAVPFGASNAGQLVDAVHPHLALAYPDRRFVEWETGALASSDLVMAALPHGETQRLADAILADGIPFVDLGADFRLDSADEFEAWYGEPHQRPDLLDSFTYGLPEFFREQIRSSSRVAAPGCLAHHGDGRVLVRLQGFERVDDEEELHLAGLSDAAGVKQKRAGSRPAPGDPRRTTSWLRAPPSWLPPRERRRPCHRRPALRAP